MSIPIHFHPEGRKANDQFPMSEYLRDPSAPDGWKTVSHPKQKHKGGIAPDSSNLNPDAMDEGFDDVSEIEPDE